MTFQDIFKKPFLEGYTPDKLSMKAIAVCLVIACVIGMYIFVTHRLLFRKSFYNKSFGISLIALAVVTAAIILAVQSSVVISLGMVGALSIVRFRTAIKDPMDLVFLFWSISVGIICGAGLTAIAAVLSVIVSVVLWLFNAMPAAKPPVLLLMTTRNVGAESAVLEIVNKYCKWAKVKSRTMTSDQLDLVIEIRGAEECALAPALMALDGVTSATILEHDGEVTMQ